MRESTEDDVSVASKERSRCPRSLFFWGTSLVFPDWVVRTIKAEASASQSIRIKSLDEMRRHTDRHPDGRHPHVWMVFFDDTVANDVLTNFESVREQVGGRDLGSGVS